jgi:hypothetical protein
MMAKAGVPKVVLAMAVFISAASTRALRPAVIVSTPGEPIKVFGAQSVVDVPLDVDGDGSIDFNFNQVSTSQLTLEPTTGGRMVVTIAGGRVTPLTSGVEIGPVLGVGGLEWAGRSSISACAAFPHRYVCLGEFFGLDAYIGIEFPIDGSTHYGWIRFDHFEISPGGWILEWAYETRPGVPIKAGAKPVVVPMAAPEVARAGYLRLKWPSEVGKAYQVQTKTRMDALRWTNLDFVIPATSTETMVDLPMIGAFQFFRVIEAD